MEIHNITTTSRTHGHRSRAKMAIGPGLAPGTTASGLMTEVISPGREPARDQWGVHVATPHGEGGGGAHRSRAMAWPGTNKSAGF